MIWWGRRLALSICTCSRAPDTQPRSTAAATSPFQLPSPLTRCSRMYAMILCSPSPGLLASERMTWRAGGMGAATVSLERQEKRQAQTLVGAVRPQPTCPCPHLLLPDSCPSPYPSVARAHLDAAPAGVLVEALVHVVLQRDRQAVHEGRAGGDDVGVKHRAAVLLGHVDALRGGRGGGKGQQVGLGSWC